MDKAKYEPIPPEQRWKKGQSGNPAGRAPDLTPLMLHQAGKHAPAFYTKLERLASGDDPVAAAIACWAICSLAAQRSRRTRAAQAKRRDVDPAGAAATMGEDGQ